MASIVDWLARLLGSAGARFDNPSVGPSTFAPHRGADFEDEIWIPFEHCLSGGKAPYTPSWWRRCSMCGGGGAPQGRKCIQCNGTGRVHWEEPMLTITIPRGVRAGQKLRVRGKGYDGTNNGPAGDLLLRVRFLGSDSIVEELPNSDETIVLPAARPTSLPASETTRRLDRGKEQLGIREHDLSPWRAIETRA